MCAFAQVRKSHLVQQLQLESPLAPFKDKQCHSLRPRGLWHSLPVLVELNGGVGGEIATLGASQTLDRALISENPLRDTSLLSSIYRLSPAEHISNDFHSTLVLLTGQRVNVMITLAAILSVPVILRLRKKNNHRYVQGPTASSKLGLS